MQQFLDWAVAQIGGGDVGVAVIVLLASFAASHAGYHLMGFVRENWAKRNQ
jgi:hypothetical protein